MIAMLLDNHYGPDRRVAFESSLLTRAGLPVRIVAWDRRPPTDDSPPGPPATDLRRVPLPAPPAGGLRSIIAMTRWSFRIYRERRRLLEGVSLLVIHDVYLLPLGYLLAKRLRIPFAYDAHEDFALLEFGRYPSSLRRLVAALETSLGRRAQVVVVPGQSRVARWTGKAKRIAVLPNIGANSPPPVDQELALKYDLVHCGGIEPARGVDLLMDLAERRPDLRVAIAGSGREASAMQSRAAEMPNVDFLGWVADPDRLLAMGSAIYYHYDPRHPYSTVACPNTLYQALRVQRPLIFICGGEPEVLNQQFRIGIAPEPSIAGLEAALAAVHQTDDWEFAEAWASVADVAALDRYTAVIRAAAGAKPAPGGP